MNRNILLVVSIIVLTALILSGCGSSSSGSDKSWETVKKKGEFGIGFRKSDVKLMQKVQETLEKMAKDGKLAEISNKWFGEDITTVSKQGGVCKV